MKMVQGFSIIYYLFFLCFMGCLPFGNVQKSPANTPLSASQATLTTTPTPTPTPRPHDGLILTVNVSDLNAGGILVLTSLSGESITVSSVGDFSFDEAFQAGDRYQVTVGVNPTGQTCIFSGAQSGLFSAQDVVLQLSCEQNRYSLGGSVSGLIGTLQLKNGSDRVSITAGSESYSFPTLVQNLSTYSVSIATSSTGQTCTLSNKTGTVSNSDVSNVNIICTTNSYSLSGTVDGLSDSVILSNLYNGEMITVDEDGSFSFTQKVDYNDEYEISVITHPTGKTCTILNSSGTMGGSNISNIIVDCFTSYLVQGTVSGLVSGNSFIITNNDENSVAVNSNGAFTFTVGLANHATYLVDVSANPTGQECSVTNGSGTIAGAKVTNVAIVCSNNSYTLSGTISGQLDDVVLQNNGGDDLTVLASDTTFEFETSVDFTEDYEVSVLTAPTGQECNVTNGSGTMGGADISDVEVLCVNEEHSIGGGVTGTAGMTGTLAIQLSGGEVVSITADSPYEFVTTVPYLDSYEVTIQTSPSNKICTLSNESGTMGTSDVTDVDITCVPSYSVGGTLSSLAVGGTITLTNNGTNATSLTSNGAYTFSTKLENGDDYEVAISSTVTGQTCVVSNASGTIAGANISNANVACSNNSYTVGGTLSGVGAASITLQINGGNNLTVSNVSSFTFSALAAQIEYLDDYEVTVLTPPTGKTCTVTNGEGTMGAANVTNVAISCSTASYTLSVVSGSTSGFVGSVIVKNISGTSTEYLTITSATTSSFTRTMPYNASYAASISGGTTSGVNCALVGTTSGSMTANKTLYLDCYLNVSALYSSGSNWNDYVLRSNSSTACTGSETSVESCLHGGDKKIVTTFYQSCSNLTLEDDLGVFDWTCNASGGGYVYFTSLLKESKGLSDLIDVSTPSSPTWKANSVTLSYNGSPVQYSASSSAGSPWWQNTVSALPADSGANAYVLGNQSRIYVLGSNYTSARGYNITADKVALVVASGATLTGNIAGNYCNSSDGTRTAPDTQCIIASGSRKFLWIEGAIAGDGDYSERIVFLYGNKFSSIRNMTLSLGSVGLYLRSSLYNTLYNISSHSHAGGGSANGITLLNSDKQLFNKIFVSNNTGSGISLNNSDYNRFSQSSSFNNTNYGLYITGGSLHNTWVILTAVANDAGNIQLDSSSHYSSFMAVTLANSAGAGIVVDASNYTTFMGGVVTNNALGGLTLQNGSDYNLVAQSVFRHNSVMDVTLDDSSSNMFTGYLLVGDSSTFCSVTGGTTPGLNAASCQGDDSSTGAVTIEDMGTLAASFVGKTTTALYASSLWTNLSSDFSTWFLNNVSSFPDAGDRSICDVAQTCQSVDWSLDSADTTLLNRTDNTAFSNGTFTEEASCPNAVLGTKVLTFEDSGASIDLTFMKNAVEKIDSGDGDFDGLCETGESCLYMPNFGSYQGSGILGSCVFSDASGDITDLTIYGYSTNGE